MVNDHENLLKRQGLSVPEIMCLALWKPEECNALIKLYETKELFARYNKALPDVVAWAIELHLAKLRLEQPALI